MSIPSFTVKEIIERIDSKEILLPSMQRKFVWSEDKIINLFDSIMRGYPFGNFIFWDIDNKDCINRYHFYQFIKDYSERDLTINEKAGRIVKSSISVVMDGQQRLTSLFIGLKGSITKKEKYKQKQLAENWKKKHLYIKPFISSDDKNEDETPYRFSFLEDDYVEAWNLDRVDYDKYYLVSDFYGLTKNEFYEQLGVKRIRAKEDDWRVVLEKLRSKMNDEEIISVHTIKNTNLVDVLEIFRRINNGGTPLSPSNLLFSTVITSWDKGREEIDEFIAAINKEKEHVFVLKEDFLIRTCLYLINKPAAAKIEILTKDVIDSIKNSWPNIKKAIIRTKNFLKDHNIYHDAILSYNAIMPIIYFFYYLDPKLSKSDVAKSEQQLIYYFSISQMFSLFGGNSASTLDAVRKSMCHDYDNNPGSIRIPFIIDSLFDIDLSAGRIHAFKISKEQIENLVDTVNYGDKKAFCLLSLLQPQIKINSGEYDVDHVCSKDELSMIIKKEKKSKDEKRELEAKRDLVPNLQLLDYKQNRSEKNADSLYTWVVEKGNQISFDPFYKLKDLEKYKLYSTRDFLSFFNQRRNLIISFLCNCFGVADNS